MHIYLLIQIPFRMQIGLHILLEYAKEGFLSIFFYRLLHPPHPVQPSAFPEVLSLEINCPLAILS